MNPLTQAGGAGRNRPEEITFPEVQEEAIFQGIKTKEGHPGALSNRYANPMGYNPIGYSAIG